MDLYRAKHGFMEKFPGDVCSAERKTNGNPDILDDPRVAPDKKRNYSSIFGSSLKRKGAKDSPKGRSRTNKINSPGSAKKTFSLITHPRFLGNDDSDIKRLVQTPSSPKAPDTEYQCHSCNFKANRVEVIILHAKFHFRRPLQETSPKKTKTTPKKTKKKQLPTSKTQTIEEDLPLLKQGLPHFSDNSSANTGTGSDESDDEPLLKKKSKPKSPPKPKKQRVAKATPAPEVKKQTDIRTDLLAEWDDDEDEEEPAKNTEITITEPEDLKIDTEPSKPGEKDKSCFDFVEDEEDVVTKLEGRRLPRVIPPTDKRKSLQELEKEISRISRSPSPHSNDLESNLGALKSNIQEENEDNEGDINKKKESQFQLEFEAFNHALKEMTVPDVTSLNKFEQNFPNVKTIKFPDKPNVEAEETPPTTEITVIADVPKVDDKPEEDKKDEDKPLIRKTETSTVKEPTVKSTEVATKLTNPKKRFAKTFEDETKNSKESALQELRKELDPELQQKEGKELEVAKLKTQLMRKLSDSPPKQNSKPEEKKPKKNVPRYKKKITEIAKVEVPEDKSNKRVRTDSNNEYGFKPHAKRKRYSAEAKDLVKDSSKDKNKSKDVKSVEEKQIIQENLNTSSDLSDLNVDDDELLNANVLSESQKLTIQNIIGVNSPISTVPPIVEKMDTEGIIKSKKGERLQSLTPTDEGNEIIDKSIKSQINVETSNKEEITNKPSSAELERSITEIEANIDHISNNQVCAFTDKLSTEISEHLPEEIIEKPKESIMQKQMEVLIEKQENIAHSPRKEFSNAVEEKKVDDPIKKVSEEQFEKFLEEKITKVLDENEDITADGKTAEEKKSGCVIENITEKITKHEVVIPIEKREEEIEDKNKQAPSVDVSLENESHEIHEVQLDDKDNILTRDNLKIEEDNECINTPTTDIFEKQIEDIKDHSLPTETTDKSETEISQENFGKTKNDLVKTIFPEEEMVNIEGNLTVVTERDLADKQVEITAAPEVSKPITLSSFSMDFCDDMESYIKGDDIMETYSKPRSVSPVTAKEKIEIKDNTQKDSSVQDIKSSNDDDENKDLHNLQGKLIEKENLELQKEVERENMQTIQNTSVEKIDCENNKPEILKINDKIKSTKGVENEVVESTVSVNEDEQVTKNTISNIPKEKDSLPEIKISNTTVKEEEKDKIQKDNTAVEVAKEVIHKEEIIIPPMDISVESEVAKITDSLIEQEIVIQDKHQNTTSRKLLEILTDKPKTTSAKQSPAISTQPEEIQITSGKQTYKHAKFVSRSSLPGTSRTPKATILDDKLIKPLDESKTVSVKKVTSKRTFQDVEDIDAYIIQKPPKKLNVSVEPEIIPKTIKNPVVTKGKARILQQTIITPTGDILQPPVTQSQTDDNMFDINSMPIVLSDQILTPESIENMQIVLQENTTTKPQINPIKKVPVTTSQQVKLLNKGHSSGNIVSTKETILKNPTPPKSYISTKQKFQKVYPTASSSPKVLKSNPSVIAHPGKQGKFIIVPATTTATGTKYTVGKRPAIVKKPPPKTPTPINKIPDVPMTSSGNKIMILKSQGQQQKILVTTPQKQTPTKLKGRPIGQKQVLTKESPLSKGANIISQTIVNSKGQITTLPSQGITGNRGQIITSMAHQSRNLKLDPTKMKRPPQQRILLQNELPKPSTSGQRTIIIKNPQGQTVKKIQGTDDALLDQQVAEQLQAISRASASQQLKDISTKATTKSPLKKPGIKKQELSKPPAGTKAIVQTTVSSTKPVSVPPLAPISPVKKVESQFAESAELAVVTGEKVEEVKRPPHQLVIQDAQGNQTTITEGQILALPSEAIDGQPHSYVLVTLDESGNLTPLNSEALMSLDPNLNLTSDLGNMVLQIDQGAATENETKTPQQSVVQEQVEVKPPENVVKETISKPSAENILSNETPASEADQNVQAVINSGEMGQLIITGDAATAQKFLESLAEGNADLANLLANAEGNVLIQADGQQILINTDSENSMLVMNPDNMSTENSEGSGNPIFASQPVKNQDILAAALADTDVFQQDQSITHSPSKVAQSQLSPNSALYPMNVGNVLETNSMSSPIMTPLEVPSTNSKKIDDENEILTQVPKNVDLPITITDPNISQTVAQQQLMATELPANLDLPLAIQDPGISVTSTEMSSPSFVYSLPTLDDTVDINQKSFSGSISMPLLTEEPEDSVADSSNSSEALTKDIIENDNKSKLDDDTRKSEKEVSSDNLKSVDTKTESDKKTDFIQSEGLCAMRGGICNSLSEPPPDMFDFSVENQTFGTPHLAQTTDMDIPIDTTTLSSEVNTTINDQESSASSGEDRKAEDTASYTVNTTSPSTNTDDSCEIPLQPLIIAKPFEENGTSDSRYDEDKVATDGDV